jgi:hypothetical protein
VQNFEFVQTLEPVEFHPLVRQRQLQVLRLLQVRMLGLLVSMF